ncbi:MAG: LacI family DNA-binding transcriptional regulator [Bacillaceae bacterium]
MEKKKPTIKDVAKKANVSKATVSYVLNNVDKVSEETRQKVLQAMKELNYIPSSTARDLAKTSNMNFKDEAMTDNPFYYEFVHSYIGSQLEKETFDEKKQLLKSFENSGVVPNFFMKQLKRKVQVIVGIILPIEGSCKQKIFRNNPFYQELLNGIEEAAREHDIILKVMYVDDIQEKDSEFNQYPFMGLIVIGKVKDRILDILDERKIPLIHIDDYCEDRDHVHVLSNDKEGAFQGVSYLIERGYRHIGFVGGIAQYCSVNQNRYDGYKEALFKHDANFDKENVFIVSGHAYEQGIEVAKAIINRKEKVDALFCISDITAIGVMKGLREGGISVPEDIAVIGFDNIQASKYCYPELTTINQHIYEKGKISINLLIQKMKGTVIKQEFIVPVSIVERESVLKK